MNSKFLVLVLVFSTVLMTTLFITAVFSAPVEHDKLIALQTTSMPPVSFQDDELSEVLAWLSQISGTDFIASRGLQEETMTVTMNLSRARSVHQMLKLIADLYDLEFRLKDGIILVSNKDEIVDPLQMRVYEVSSLQIKTSDFPGPEVSLSGDKLFPASVIDNGVWNEEEVVSPDEIVELIKEFTGGDSWNEVDGTSIEVLGGKLLVRQTEDTHGEIVKLLEILGD